MTQSQISILNGITNTRTQAAYSAQAILEQYYGYSFPIAIESLEGNLEFRNKNNSNNQVNKEIVLWISPNPVNDKLFLYLSNTIDQAKDLQIVDVNGNICLQQLINDMSKPIAITNLQSGTYMVFVKSEKGNIAKSKFINSFIMKYIFLFWAIFFSSAHYAQTFDTVYRSFKAMHNTVDAILSCHELDSNKILYISVGIATDSSRYRFSFGTIIDSNGTILMSKLLYDSIIYINPYGMQLYIENKLIIYGSKRNPKIKKSNYWYGIYDNNLKLIEEHEYLTPYDDPRFLDMKIDANGDFVFCGINNKYDNRGNGASELSRASVLCTDHKGNLKWQHEFWDSNILADVHQFRDMVQDSLGNLYACGHRTRSDFTGAGIIAKIDSMGKLIWYKEYNPGNYSEVYVNVKILSNNRICIIGTDSNPDRLTSDQWSEICYTLMDTAGNIIFKKRMHRTYGINLEKCITDRSGDLVCAGLIIESEKEEYDGFIANLSTAGNLIWTNKIEHSKKDPSRFYNIANASNAGFYLVGYNFIPGIIYSQNWLVKTDSNGCAINNCINTGTEGSYNSDKEFSIYPNPAQDFVFIKNADPYTSTFLSFELYDVNGKRLVVQEVRNEETKINMSNLPEGIYIYKLMSNDKMLQTGKVVISRSR